MSAEGPERPSQPVHIPVLDHLRGLAALAVCFYHLTKNDGSFLPETDPLRQLCSVGWLGVEAFFVISGFVIPYSLYHRKYKLRDAAGFFIRRLKRLEPPYFACIFLVLFLNYASALVPGYRGGAKPIDAGQLLAHVAYLNAILDYQWLAPVFWTLAIEFQYYMLVALIFPLLNHPSGSVRTTTVLSVAGIGFLGAGNEALLPHWLPLFAIGMLTFQAYVSLRTTGSFVLLLANILPVSIHVVGGLQTSVGLGTALIIYAVASRPLPRLLTPLAMAGTISYSLYLVHTPIGRRIINLAKRLPDSPLYQYPAVLVAFMVSMTFAYLFWRFVEKPSQAWSKASSRRTVAPPRRTIPAVQTDVTRSGSVGSPATMTTRTQPSNAKRVLNAE